MVKMTKIYALIVGIMACCSPLAVYGQETDWLCHYSSYAGGDAGQAQMLSDTIWVADALRPDEAIRAIDAMLDANPSLLGVRAEPTRYLKSAYEIMYCVRGKGVPRIWDVATPAAVSLVGHAITPLMTAVLTKNTTLVRHLLDFERAHPIPQEVMSAEMPYEPGVHDQLLMLAAANGDVPMAELLIEYGANVSAVVGRDQPWGGSPVLCRAIDSGSLEMFTMLVKRGAHLDEFATQTNNPFQVRNLTMLGCLIVSRQNEMLRVALENIKHVAISTYVNEFVDLTSGHSSITPLMLAAAVGNVPALVLLLRYGADATVKNMQDGGKAALDYATEYVRNKGSISAIDLVAIDILQAKSQN